MMICTGCEVTWPTRQLDFASEAQCFIQLAGQSARHPVSVQPAAFGRQPQQIDRGGSCVNTAQPHPAELQP